MANEEIPSGKNTRESQADGAVSAPSEAASPAPSAASPAPSAASPAPSAASPAASEEDPSFEVSAFWSGDGAGSGRVTIEEGSIDVPIAGAKRLGGAGSAANPEELLLAAVAACFVNTWAIFLQKLQVEYAEPALRVTGTLSKDEAGGFRMSGAVIHARVPGTLLASDKAKVEKTLALAEKYCIISKVARAAMPVKVEIEPV